jgi:hypothetical protein
VTGLKIAGPTSGFRCRMLSTMNVTVQFGGNGTAEHSVTFMYLIIRFESEN